MSQQSDADGITAEQHERIRHEVNVIRLLFEQSDEYWDCRRLEDAFREAAFSIRNERDLAHAHDLQRELAQATERSIAKYDLIAEIRLRQFTAFMNQRQTRGR